MFFHELAHTIHRTFEAKSGHGQEPEAEAIAQLAAATLARLYGRPADGFSWTYIASQMDSASPQKVGRLYMRVLDRTKKVLDLIYLDGPASTTETIHPPSYRQVVGGNPYEDGIPPEGQEHGT